MIHFSTSSVTKQSSRWKQNLHECPRGQWLLTPGKQNGTQTTSGGWRFDWFNHDRCRNQPVLVQATFKCQYWNNEGNSTSAAYSLVHNIKLNEVRQILWRHILDNIAASPSLKKWSFNYQHVCTIEMTCPCCHCNLRTIRFPVFALATSMLCFLTLVGCGPIHHNI